MAELYRMDMRNVDLNKPLMRTNTGVLLATGDKAANRFGAVLCRDGAPVNLTGCAVVGWFIRPDMDTLACDGVVDGNTVYVDLPEACYTHEGAFSLAIKVSSTEIRQTVRVIDGCIRLTQTDAIVDPGETVPSLDDLLAHIAEMEAAVEEAREITGEAAEYMNASPPAIVVDVSGDVVAIADGAERAAQSVVSVIEAAQSGTGNPSPDNVRAISGWDAVRLWHGAEYNESAAVLNASLPETVYGGTLDWTTGLLTVTHLRYVATGDEVYGIYTYNGSNGVKIENVLWQVCTRADGVCSHAPVKLDTTGALQVWLGVSNNGIYVIGLLDALGVSTEAEAAAWFKAQYQAGTPVTFVYELLEPKTTYQLTAQQLDMLKGSNALWSDCGGTSVTYIADTKLYIDNKFNALQAAILAQGANI